MSHLTTMQTQIKDLDALKAAVKELGLEWGENVQCREYFNSPRKPMVIKVKGASYDIAVAKASDGTYQLITDWYNGSVAGVVGEKFAKLIGLTGIHKATMLAKSRGFTVQRLTRPNNQIELRMTRRGL